VFGSIVTNIDFRSKCAESEVVYVWIHSRLALGTTIPSFMLKLF